MIGRFNYLKRHKVLHDDIKVALHKDNEGMWFSCSVNLDDYDFDPEDKVSITASYKGLKERFDFGTIDKMFVPEKNRITKIHGTSIVYFVIKVTGKNGVLRGLSKPITLGLEEFDSQKIPLFYVNLEDLGEQCWNLDFQTSECGRPILVINSKIPDLQTKMTSDINMIFHIYPFAFRMALHELVKRGDEDDEYGDWTGQWKTYITDELGIKSLPDFELDGGNMTNQQYKWIDECVEEFCKKQNLFEKFLKA